MKTRYCLAVVSTIFVDIALAQGNATGSSESGTTDISKAFISLGVLGAACVAAFVIAKIVDHCYDRAALRDDASDISEHTRQLIRARIALSRFKRPIKDKKKKKKKNDKESKKNTKLFFKLWSKNAKTKGSKKNKADIVINVEEANVEDQLQVNGSSKMLSAHPHPHVTFIDEVNQRGTESEGAVISIAVPTLKPSNTTSSKEAANHPSILNKHTAKNTDATQIPTISGKVAERENSGKTLTRKETSGNITHVKANSGSASPAKDNTGIASPTKDNSGGTTPVETTSGRNTPANETKLPASSGRSTPTSDKNTKSVPLSGRVTPSKENHRSSPVVTVASRPGTGRDTAPRSSSTSPTKTAPKTPPVAPNRPKTAPVKKPVGKVVVLKTNVVKTPIKSSSKASPRTTSAKSPKSVPIGKVRAGATPEVNSSTRTAGSVVVSVDKGNDK